MKRAIQIHKKEIVVMMSLIILSISMFLAIISKQIHIVDDSWITFRVSNNLLNHGELNYNLGYKVEGISNLLWAVILAFIAFITPLKIPAAAVILSLLFVAYSIYRLWKIGILLGLNPIIATIPSVFLLFSPDFIGTATNGLEMPLCLFLILDAIWFYLNEKYPISFLFLGLLFLTRIETIGILIIFLFLLFIYNKFSKIKTMFLSTAIYLVFVVVATIGRYLYYGDFIPNSVRAKQIDLSSGLILSGVRYILDFANQNPIFVVILFASTFLLIVKIFRLRSLKRVTRIDIDKSFQLLIISFFCILFSFIVVMKNGGDWMPNFRLLFLYSGFYACLFFILLKQGTLSIIFSLALLVGPFILTSDLALARIRHEQNFSFVDYSAGMNFWGEASSQLAPEIGPTDIVSAEAIGYIGYSLPNTYIHDPLGLTDRNIAISGIPAVPFGKTNIEYSVNVVRPSVMIWHYTGHLHNLDLRRVDSDYKTFCFENCESWNAHVVMIRNDRLQDLAKPFEKWAVIKLQDLP